MCIYVAIASKNDFVRSGLRYLLDNQPDVTVVGDEDNTAAIMNLVAATHPDVVVIELALVPHNGVKIEERIARDWADANFIVFSLRRNSEYINQCLSAGARGYVLAESLGAEIVIAVREVVKGRLYLSPQLSYTNTALNGNPDDGSGMPS
jgi:DNA-binding NarL/FixJ family response regulator